MSLRTTALALVSAMTLALGLSANPAAAQTNLKWAHVYETSEPFHTESVWAAQEIEKRTDGRYHIDVYPASQLGKETDLNQGLTLGSVEIIISGSSFAARSFKPIGVTYYPYTFRDADHLLAYTKSDVFQELAQGYEDKTGHHIVAVTYYGTRHTSSNKPIRSCADMQGLKMRVPDVPAYLAMPRACGANTAPIAFAEVYLALQNGHIVDHLNTVISKTLWDQLSEEDRKIFTEVALEAAARASKQIQTREAELVQFFKDKGLNVTEVNKQDFIDAVHKNTTFEQYGYEKADWDAIEAIQ
jgi:TRAP-type C4-dicarboxylate transport system substrate-binding protein